MIRGTRIPFLLGILLLFGGLLGSKLSSDETALFFPSYATQSPDGSSWIVHLHAWVFELEPDSFFRAGVIKAFAAHLEASETESASELFRSRARYFVTDNERGKEIPITIGKRSATLGPTEANGHLEAKLTLTSTEIEELRHTPPENKQSYIIAKIDRADSNDAPTELRIQLIEPTGISVVSDLDDTIKVSNVHSKRALLKSTFLSEYEAVPGMSGVYQNWSRQGAHFHYVSASPWQLYPPVSAFLLTQGFPGGTVSMKSFRWKDSSFFDLFVNNDSYKRPLIERHLLALPKHAFYLVGDSGEKDVELYCSLAEQYPNQVKRIFIRNTPGIPSKKASLEKSCLGAVEKLVFFESAEELPPDLK